MANLSVLRRQTNALISAIQADHAVNFQAKQERREEGHLTSRRIGSRATDWIETRHSGNYQPELGDDLVALRRACYKTKGMAGARDFLEFFPSVKPWFACMRAQTTPTCKSAYSARDAV